MLIDAEQDFRRRLTPLLPRLGRYALGLTRSRSEADDLLQAACERALGRIEQWDPATRLDSWMFRITQTVWFNELRSRGVRERHGRESEGWQEPAEDGELIAETRNLLSCVEQEIGRMPDSLRSVLMLVCVEGFTYSEAAEIASVPVGTIMSRLARARVTLTERLAARERQCRK